MESIYTKEQQLAIYEKLLAWLHEVPADENYLCWGLSWLCERMDLYSYENYFQNSLKHPSFNYAPYPEEDFEQNFPDLWSLAPVDSESDVWFYHYDDEVNKTQRIQVVTNAIKLIKCKI